MSGFEIPLGANRKTSVDISGTYNALGSGSTPGSQVIQPLYSMTPFNQRLMVFVGVSSDPTVVPDQLVVKKAFQINPQRLQRVSSKNQSIIFLGRNRGKESDSLYSPSEFHFLSLKYETFAYTGVTPSFNPIKPGGFNQPGDSQSQFTDYSQSPGYQWFLDFIDFYDMYGDKVLVMKYLDKQYLGVFNSFDYSRIGDSPFNIPYSFSFSTFMEFSVNEGMFLTQQGINLGKGQQGYAKMIGLKTDLTGMDFSKTVQNNEAVEKSQGWTPAFGSYKSDMAAGLEK